MADVPSLCKAFDTSRDTINGWLKRGLIHSPIPRGKAGVGRELTREAATEIALMVSLTDMGFDVAEAGYRARLMMSEESFSKATFAAFDAGRTMMMSGGRFKAVHQIAQLFGEINEGALISEHDDSRSEKITESLWFKVLNLREIQARLDALFEGE